MAAKLQASVSVLALGVALVSGSALAYEQGDMVLRGGIAMVDPGIMLGGAIPTALLAVFMNWFLGRMEYYLLSPGLRQD